MSSNSCKLIRSSDYSFCSVVLNYYPSKGGYILTFSDCRDFKSDWFFIEYDNALSVYYRVCELIDKFIFTFI